MCRAISPGKFFRCLKRLSPARRRDGAYGWGITEDAADSERIVEWFLVESWAEHLRQHHRLSNADADIQRETKQFHIGPNTPVVRHFLALELDDIDRHYPQRDAYQRRTNESRPLARLPQLS